MPTIRIVPKAERSLQRRHPWIFSGAVGGVEGDPRPGATVSIVGADGAALGHGAWSPASEIRARVWTFDPGETVNESFFRRRLQRAIGWRRPLLARGDRTACRLVNSESDGLPGVVVDRYADWLVCQFLTAGAEFWKDTIVRLLGELLPSSGLYERSDVDQRKYEGLGPRVGPLAGGTPPDSIRIREGPCTFDVDVLRGHKTGFYLDQSDNRPLAAELAPDACVLNAFAYTGAFGIWALKGGARRVTHVDSSAAAIEGARRHSTLNDTAPDASEFVEGSVAAVLRTFRDSRRQFDLIVLDPPKFAEARAYLPAASRAYKDINLLAFKLLGPGGFLMTFSCSGHMNAELFQKIVADAALDARRDVQILRRLGQASDHPALASFPEATYLKGLICRAL